MNPNTNTNPYACEAVSSSPELVDGQLVRDKMILCLNRLRNGKPAKSMILVGLHGVGKTLLLEQMLKDAEEIGVITLCIEMPIGRSLPALLISQLGLTLLKLSHIEQAKPVAIRGLRALAGFALKMKSTYNDIEVEIDFEPEPGLADNGDLDGDLTMLLEQVGLAAKSAHTSVALFIDQLHDIPEVEMAALLSALHRCVQRQLPLMLVGSGLPQIRRKIGEVKSYAERLFEFYEIGQVAIKQ